MNDVLLSAFAWALCRWTARSRASIDLESHGREGILDGVDVFRTVSRFTSTFSVALTVPNGVEPTWRDLIRSVRRQLRAVPDNGFRFRALRYLGSPAICQRLAMVGKGPEVSFNYLGQRETPMWDPGDGLYRAVHGPVGQHQDPADPGQRLLKTVGGVHNGQLRFSWFYRPDVHRQASAQPVASDSVEELKSIARGFRGPK